MGVPGTRETDLLAPDKSRLRRMDALVLSGSSAYGLDACSAWSTRLRAAGRGFRLGDATTRWCREAILFDLLNGGDRRGTNPLPRLGRAALWTADNEDFNLAPLVPGTGA